MASVAEWANALQVPGVMLGAWSPLCMSLVSVPVLPLALPPLLLFFGTSVDWHPVVYGHLFIDGEIKPQ